MRSNIRERERRFRKYSDYPDSPPTQNSEPVVVGVASGAGGTGKTVSVINLSAALAHGGRNVLLVDADPIPRIPHYLSRKKLNISIPAMVYEDALQKIHRGEELSEQDLRSIVRSTSFGNLSLILPEHGDRVRLSVLLGEEGVASTLLNSLRSLKDFDYVVVDLAAGNSRASVISPMEDGCDYVTMVVRFPGPETLEKMVDGTPGRNILARAVSTLASILAPREVEEDLSSINEALGLIETTEATRLYTAIKRALTSASSDYKKERSRGRNKKKPIDFYSPENTARLLELLENHRTSTTSLERIKGEFPREYKSLKDAFTAKYNLQIDQTQLDRLDLAFREVGTPIVPLFNMVKTDPRSRDNALYALGDFSDKVKDLGRKAIMLGTHEEGITTYDQVLVHDPTVPASLSDRQPLVAHPTRRSFRLSDFALQTMQVAHTLDKYIREEHKND